MDDDSELTGSVAHVEETMDPALARELKDEVLQDLLRPARGATRAMRAHPAPGWVAVGLAPASGRDPRVAVRVQSRASLESPTVARALERVTSRADVRVIGPVRALGGGPSVARAGLIPGASVAHLDVTAGTLGCFVSDASDGVGILSNNHVLANTNRGALGDPVLSPGPADGGGPSDRIGYLANFVRIEPAGNEVDAAFARLDGPADPGSNAVNGVWLTGSLDDDEIADLLGRVSYVRKRGRTTGLTLGTVTAVEVDGVGVGYDDGPAVFDRNVEIEGADGKPFSRGGDSGSVIHTAEGHCFGLLYAGAAPPGPTFASPLHLALSAMGLRLL